MLCPAAITTFLIAGAKSIIGTPSNVIGLQPNQCSSTSSVYDSFKNPSAPRFSHTFAVYEGGRFPERYRGKLDADGAGARDKRPSPEPPSSD